MAWISFFFFFFSPIRSYFIIRIRKVLYDISSEKDQSLYKGQIRIKIREIEICIKIGSLLINGEYIPRIEQSFHEKGNS